VTGCLSLRLGDSDAALVIEDVIAGPGESRLKQRTGKPTRMTVRYGESTKRREADLYTPAGTSRAALVLVPGLTPAGKSDPRLVDLAETLARMGFTVLVPEVPGFRSYRVAADDIDVLADALHHVETLPSMDARRPVGIGAFSYAVGPALIAATRAGIAERVDFVVGVGGYYDLRSLIAYYTTGAHRGDGDGPTPYDTGKWFFAMGIANRLPDENDRRIIEGAARRAVFAGGSGLEPVNLAGLTPGGAAFMELLENTRAERVPGLLAQLPRDLKDEISALNPAEKDLGRLSARLILLHGRNDQIIPYTQSVALAGAVPGDQVQLFLIDGLAHVALEPTWGDVDILLEMVTALLAQRAPDSDESG
jgi:pimeloyl-ACP methyl ester carboxylesterase